MVKDQDVKKHVALHSRNIFWILCMEIKALKNISTVNNLSHRFLFARDYLSVSGNYTFNFLL